MNDFNPAFRNPKDFLYQPTITDRIRSYLFPPTVEIFSVVDYLLIIDISHWNREPDFVALKDGGYVGVIMKATQGVSSEPDPKFHQFWPKVIDAGLAPGAYHMADFSYGGVAQADFHMETIRPMVEASQGEYIRSHLDIELNDGATIGQRQNRGTIFMQEIKDEQGRAGSYSSKSKWQQLMGNMELVDPRDGVRFDGWNALWSPYPMTVWPTGWTKEQIKMRQIGHSGYDWVEQPPGTSGSIDVNHFFGTRAEFNAWIGAQAPPSDDLEGRVARLEDDLDRIDLRLETHKHQPGEPI